MKQAAPPNTEKNTEMYFICEKWNTTNTTNMKLNPQSSFDTWGQHHKLKTQQQQIITI